MEEDREEYGDDDVDRDDAIDHDLPDEDEDADADADAREVIDSDERLDGRGRRGPGRAVPRHERTTTPYMTKYERARILGRARASTRTRRCWCSWRERRIPWRSRERN